MNRLPYSTRYTSYAGGSSSSGSIVDSRTLATRRLPATIAERYVPLAARITCDHFA